MKRREFIKKTGQAVSIAAVSGSAGIWINGCQSGSRPKTKLTKPDFEVEAESQFPAVALARHEEHPEALRLALDAIGGISRFVKSGERVLLKPNVAWDRVPEQAVNTNPDVVGEMVRQCIEAGASDVMVTDFGSHNAPRTFSRSGIRRAVEQNGGRILILDDDDFVEAEFNGRFISNWPVLRYIYETERLINMPIAKHHGLVYGTASMKNFFGIIGGDRNQLHKRIDQAIVDLAAFFKPTLTVVDATRVLMRNGPQGGSIDDVKRVDTVICATDQVAADSRACEFLGLSGRDVRHVIMAAEQGLGEIDYRKAGYKEVV